MQKSLIKNTFFNIIYTLTNILFPFITSIYISRILMPVGVGKVAAAQNIVSYFVTLAALGLPSYGVREFSKIREKKVLKNKLFSELFIINLISTSLSLVAYLLLLLYNGAFNGEWSLYIYTGFMILFNYLNVDWVYQGLEEYGYITIRSIIIKILSLLMLFLFVKTKSDYAIYALISSLALGGNYMFNMFNIRHIVKFSVNGISIKNHLKPIIYIAFIIFMSTLYNKVDITMLQILSTNESIGYYTFAQRTVNIVLTMCSAVTATLLPRLSFYHETDLFKFYSLIEKGFQILCFFITPLTVGLFFLAGDFVLLLYGRDFSPSALTIRMMCPLIIIRGLGDLLCYQLAYSSKNERILLPASILASIANVTVNILLIPKFNQNGAVIASILSEFITNCIQFIYLKRKIKYHIDLKCISDSVISSIVMVCFIFIISKFNLSIFSRFIVEIVTGVVVYFIINYFIKNKIMFEILNNIMKKYNNNHRKNV